MYEIDAFVKGIMGPGIGAVGIPVPILKNNVNLPER